MPIARAAVNFNGTRDIPRHEPGAGIKYGVRGIFKTPIGYRAGEPETPYRRRPRQRAAAIAGKGDK